MPSNKLPQGNGMKGGNYDELTGVGKAGGGSTGTVGDLNGADNDGGIGTPDLADEGNLQSSGGQPGGTPAQGDSWRSRGNVQGGTDDSLQAPSNRQGNRQSAYETVNQDDEADRLRGTPDDRPLAARQESSDEVGTARPSKN